MNVNRLLKDFIKGKPGDLQMSCSQYKHNPRINMMALSSGEPLVMSPAVKLHQN